MKKPHAPGVRELLTAHPFGLTRAEICEALGVSPDAIRKVLKAMPDVYIDRWTAPKRGQYQAVWCKASVPEHCPRPGLRPRVRTRARIQTDEVGQ